MNWVVFLAILYTTRAATIDDFENILELHQIANNNQGESTVLSDLGCWHGYGLPPNDSLVSAGGFSGPFIHSSWGANLAYLGLSLSKIVLHDPLSSGEVFKTIGTTSSMFPGRLTNKVSLVNSKNQGAELELTMIFVDSRTSVCEVRPENCQVSPLILSFAYRILSLSRSSGARDKHWEPSSVVSNFCHRRREHSQ
jgi:hypothetical protein